MQNTNDTHDAPEPRGSARAATRTRHGLRASARAVPRRQRWDRYKTEPRALALGFSHKPRFHCGLPALSLHIAPLGAIVSSQGRQPLVTAAHKRVSPEWGDRSPAPILPCRPYRGSGLRGTHRTRGWRPWLMTAAPLRQQRPRTIGGTRQLSAWLSASALDKRPTRSVPERQSRVVCQRSARAAIPSTGCGRPPAPSEEDGWKHKPKGDGHES